jgi:hypothetical protein
MQPRDRPVSRNGAFMPDPWTPERIGFLMQLWAGGATAQVIAARLGGLSRSAVLGKIYRLRRAGELLAPAKMRPAHRVRQTEPLPPPPASEPQGLLDLTNNSCRWIVEAAIKWAVTATLSHFQ